MRQTDTDNVASNSQALQLFPDGSCKIHLPIVGYSPYNSESLNISNEKVKDKLREIIAQMLENKHILKFANLGDCAWVAVACIKYYLNWLTSSGWNSSLWVRIELTEAWRFVPIVNSEHWVKWIDDLGLPVCSHSSVAIPFDALYLIYSYDDKDEIVNECFRGIFECFGIAPYGEYAALIGDDLIHRAGNNPK